MPTLPPFLTEQWASAYFQILFSVLVFAIGIPFLGLQLVMQEDVRHVVTYRQWKIVLWLILVVALFLSAVSFIWILHPVPDRDDARRPAAEQQMAEGPQNDPDDWWKRYQAYVAGLIVTVIPLPALAFAYWLPTNYTRKKVIRQFEGEVLAGLKKGRRLKKDALSKLIYLGEYGNPGVEKNLVLDAIKRIAQEVQREEGSYRGDELAEIVRSIRVVLENNEKPGNDDNYRAAASLLRQVWSRVPATAPTTLDATVAASVLKRLGVEAVRLRSDETAQIYVKHAAACDDSVVFQLGLAALAAKRFRIAADALSKLESMALADGGGRLTLTETTKNLLGLLAHFAASGASGRRRADDFLHQARESFSSPLEKCVREALDYHYYIGNFDTADNLTVTLKALRGEPA